MAAPSPVKRPSQAGNLSIKQSIYNRGQEFLAEMYQPEASATRLQSLGFVSKLTAYLRARPIMVLALLTPGIPEYLSGSSSTTWLALNPTGFSVFLVLNMGLYTTGVLLIREAMVHWRRGWAPVFLLGFAYAIVEEGLALRTLY